MKKFVVASAIVLALGSNAYAESFGKTCTS